MNHLRSFVASSFDKLRTNPERSRMGSLLRMTNRGVFYNRPRLVIYLISLLVGVLGGVGAITPRPSAAADIREIGFDKNHQYDIYFEYEVIKGAKILGTKDIQGEAFLVVSTSNLKTKETEGYIRFSTIKAILPSGYINVQTFDSPYPSPQVYK